MVKTIAKILFIIAVIWTLAFVFKLGNSFAGTDQSEMYKSCYEDGKSNLGKARAKQFCKCSTEMLFGAYDSETLMDLGSVSDDTSWKRDILDPTIRHCNINPNAHENTYLELKGNDLLKLDCKRQGLSANKKIIIDTSSRIATVNKKVAHLKPYDDAFKIFYFTDNFSHEVRIYINRNTGEFNEYWEAHKDRQLFDWDGMCEVSTQLF